MNSIDPVSLNNAIDTDLSYVIAFHYFEIQLDNFTELFDPV